MGFSFDGKIFNLDQNFGLGKTKVKKKVVFKNILLLMIGRK